MYIEWPEGILDLGIISKEFLREYCILLGKLMYGNVDSAILWLILLAKYLVNECNLRMSKAESCILFRKYEKNNLKLVMSVHVDDVSMAVNPEVLNIIKEKINEKFNISESGKLKKFLGVYYEWGHDAKVTYAKMNMEKDVKKLVKGYKNYTGSELRAHKTPGYPGTTLSKSDLEYPDNINKYG